MYNDISGYITNFRCTNRSIHDADSKKLCLIGNLLAQKFRYKRLQVNEVQNLSQKSGIKRVLLLTRTAIPTKDEAILRIM
ncbi:hypothetical protein H6G06_19060 [Anabaena sphaerica FACHB-251]|uniref:Uncharacterized protein n=1 Tax=Anabaena sphaerica FACHB-251 TaxID=2692883 RepID=A0A926WJD3_9NOST|nr:hypothetical protein [Anabaena sphaerica]MBD2295512.1 hypothetical protein [Anabaena sphaerica FACHB-251]